MLLTQLKKARSFKGNGSRTIRPKSQPFLRVNVGRIIPIRRNLDSRSRPIPIDRDRGKPPPK